VLLQMSEDRKIKERTLKVEYKDIDKQFREQLIKTKVRNHVSDPTLTVDKRGCQQ
jgi:hypothetical protein